MAYSAASDVAALCQNLINTEDNFTSSTCPSLTEVNRWLSSGCAIINTRLSGAGYTTPVASTVGVYDWLRDLNTLYAAAMAEWSRTNVITSPGERTRGQRFEEMFWRDLDRLVDMDLTILGVTKDSAGKIYAGGISISDKDSVEADTDRVVPRFRRAQFATPGTVRPDALSASELSD